MTQLDLTFNRWVNSTAVRISMAPSSDMNFHADDSVGVRITYNLSVLQVCAKLKENKPDCH
jgi:hypothetical protein